MQFYSRARLSCGLDERAYTGPTLTVADLLAPPTDVTGHLRTDAKCGWDRVGFVLHLSRRLVTNVRTPARDASWPTLP